MNLEYLNLPKIPEDLIVNVYQTIRNVPASDRHSNKEGTDAENHPAWNSIKASDKLKQYVATIFQEDHDVHIFILSDDLPVHKDNTRDTAYNYILETGSAVTNFHDDAGNIIESHEIQTFTWHKLNVKTNHSVNIPCGPRVVVSVSIPWD